MIMAIMDPNKPASILSADMSNVFKCFEQTYPNFLMSNAHAVEVQEF